jgi:hypothetical protein
MVYFTLAAEYHGHQVEVTWTGGKLTDDWSTVGAIASTAVLLEGQPVV